jgi:hypothetical protein
MPKVLEVRTPELLRTIEDIEAATSGDLDPAQAKAHLAAANARIKAVGEELKARLRKAKIAARAKPRG